jgi:small conductance mechanosensitive channel
VEINGKMGTVKGLDLFSTRLADRENRAVFVPNGKAFGEIIVNYTATPTHRVQIDVQIGKHDDVDAALEAMLEVAKADKRVVAKPVPWAKLTALEDNGVKVTLRAWVSPEAWFDARFDLLKAVRDRLAADGFEFPYPYATPKPAPGEAVSRRPASPRPTTGANGQGR